MIYTSGRMNVPCNSISKLGTTALVNTEVSTLSLRPYFILSVRRFTFVLEALQRFAVGLDYLRKMMTVKNPSNKDFEAESKLCEENHVRGGDEQ